jgi:hypothetical protein
MCSLHTTCGKGRLPLCLPEYEGDMNVSKKEGGSLVRTCLSFLFVAANDRRPTAEFPNGLNHLAAEALPWIPMNSGMGRVNETSSLATSLRKDSWWCLMDHTVKEILMVGFYSSLHGVQCLA